MPWLILQTRLQLTPIMTLRSSLGPFYRGGNQGCLKLLNVCKGELLRAKRAQSTRATLPVWTLGALKWQDVLEKIVDRHHQPSLVSHS